jgi:hypothetical protein
MPPNRDVEFLIDLMPETSTVMHKVTTFTRLDRFRFPCTYFPKSIAFHCIDSSHHQLLFVSCSLVDRTEYRDETTFLAF